MGWWGTTNFPWQCVADLLSLSCCPVTNSCTFHTQNMCMQFALHTAITIVQGIDQYYTGVTLQSHFDCAMLRIYKMDAMLQCVATKSVHHRNLPIHTHVGVVGLTRCGGRGVDTCASTPHNKHLRTAQCQPSPQPPLLDNGWVCNTHKCCHTPHASPILGCPVPVKHQCNLAAMHLQGDEATFMCC